MVGGHLTCCLSAVVYLIAFCSPLVPRVVVPLVPLVPRLIFLMRVRSSLVSSSLLFFVHLAFVLSRRCHHFCICDSIPIN